MRWGEQGLEFLTVSKLEIRGSPHPNLSRWCREKKKKNWSHQETLMHFVTCFCGGNYPWFIILVSTKIPISPAKDTK